MWMFLAAVAAAAPVTLTHQGRLLDATGAPLNSVADVTVALYRGPSGGTSLWSDTVPVTFADGFYTVVLGAAGDLDSAVFDGSTVYLELRIDGTVLGDRQALVSVPYAAHASSVAGRVQVTTTSAPCTSPEDDGLLRLDAGQLYVCVADQWRPMVDYPRGTPENPGASCADVLAHQPGSPDGVYWIDPDGAGAFEVYCDMTGGGWTLVLMVRGDDPATFDYYSAAWTAPEALNGNILDPAVDENMRSLAYARMPVTALRFDLVTLGNSLIETVSAPSTLAALTGGYVASAHTRADFLSWLSDVPDNNWDNQPYCNVAGIQAAGPDPANCRYGIIMNNENHCTTADSAVGFGCHTNNHYTNTTNGDIRWTAAGGHRWSPTVRYFRRGWIWAR